MGNANAKLTLERQVNACFNSTISAPSADLPAPLLVECIARALESSLGEGAASSCSVFCSSAVPKITVHRYLRRLQRMSKCNDAALVCTLVLLDRFLMRCRRLCREPQQLTVKNVHRLLLTCLVATIKYNEDEPQSNAYYAKAGGIHFRELNRLESSFLPEVGYDLRVQPHEYRLYESALRVLSTMPPKQQCSTSTAITTPSRAVAPNGIGARLGLAFRAVAAKWWQKHIEAQKSRRAMKVDPVPVNFAFF